MKIDRMTQAEISDLNQEILILQRTAAVDSVSFSYEAEDLAQKRARLAYMGRLVRWYEGRTGEILNLIGQRDIVLSGSKRWDGHDDQETVDSKEFAKTLLDSMLRSLTIADVLPSWVRQLVHRGLLRPDQAASLDLTAPVDEVRLARQKEAQQKKADFEAGFEKLKRAALAYGQQQGNTWALYDFLNVFNAKVVPWERSEAGLLEFSAALGQRKLLPIGDRMQHSAADLWAKIKGLVA